jgi:hypothetical protein
MDWCDCLVVIGDFLLLTLLQLLVVWLLEEIWCGAESWKRFLLLFRLSLWDHILNFYLGDDLTSWFLWLNNSSKRVEDDWYRYEAVGIWEYTVLSVLLLSLIYGELFLKFYLGDDFYWRDGWLSILGDGFSLLNDPSSVRRHYCQFSTTG